MVEMWAETWAVALVMNWVDEKDNYLAEY